MAGERTEPRVLLLRCRACTATLPAASADLAFRCPQCGRGWEIESGALVERPAAYVGTPTGGGGGSHPTLHLPYWSFAVGASAEARGRADAAQLSARDRARRFRRAYVSAYAIHRPTYVGEWGLIYTRLQPDWEIRRGHGPESPGAAISSDDAREIARHYILAELDKAADLATLKVDLDVSAPELWAIPCYTLGEKIRCPWTRSELPTAALDDLSEIRRAGERREA